VYSPRPDAGGAPPQADLVLRYLAVLAARDPIPLAALEQATAACFDPRLLPASVAVAAAALPFDAAGVAREMSALQFQTADALLTAVRKFQRPADRLYALYFFASRQLKFDPSFEETNPQEIFRHRRSGQKGFALFLLSFANIISGDLRMKLFPCMVKDRSFSVLSCPTRPVVNHTVVLVINHGVPYIVDASLGNSIETRNGFVHSPNDRYFMRPLAECLADYYNEDIAPSLIACVPFRTFACVGAACRGVRCESHQSTRIAVSGPFAKLQFSLDSELPFPSVKIHCCDHGRALIAPRLYAHIEAVGEEAGRTRVFLVVFFPFAGRFEVSLRAPYTLWRGFLDAAQASRVIPFLFPGGPRAQAVPIQPLTRLTKVADGWVVMRFATLRNFDQLTVRCTRSDGEGAAETPHCCYFTFPCTACSERDEVFALTSFRKAGLYEVRFHFSFDGAAFASVSYFFDVERGIGRTVPVITASWPAQPLPESELGVLEPPVSRIVTANQSAEVTVTVGPRKSVIANLQGPGGLQQCSLVERVESKFTVKCRFVLRFADIGAYALRVAVDREFAFEQQYAFIKARIEENEQGEASLQAELAARIAALDEPRVVADIPKEVKWLVESWVQQVRA
jgi:hypothetical protein